MDAFEAITKLVSDYGGYLTVSILLFIKSEVY